MKKIGSNISPNLILIVGGLGLTLALFKGARDAFKGLIELFGNVPESLKLKNPENLNIFTQAEKANQNTKERGAVIAPRIAPHRQRILTAAKGSGESKVIITAVMLHESRGNISARGAAGEVGLMQLKQIAVDDVNENALPPGIKRFPNVLNMTPTQNLLCGALFLKLQSARMQKAASQNLIVDTLRAYNQGFSRAISDRSAGALYAELVLQDAEVILKEGLI